MMMPRHAPPVAAQIEIAAQGVVDIPKPSSAWLECSHQRERVEQVHSLTLVATSNEDDGEDCTDVDLAKCLEFAPGMSTAANDRTAPRPCRSGSSPRRKVPGPIGNSVAR